MVCPWAKIGIERQNKIPLVSCIGRYQLSGDYISRNRLPGVGPINVGSIKIDHQDFCIEAGFRWHSPLSALHPVLVFFGFVDVGMPARGFIYGVPWSLEADLVRAALLQHRGELSLDRETVNCLYSQLLGEAGFPFYGAIGSLAGWISPRHGWP